MFKATCVFTCCPTNQWGPPHELEVPDFPRVDEKKISFDCFAMSFCWVLEDLAVVAAPPVALWLPPEFLHQFPVKNNLNNLKVESW